MPLKIKSNEPMTCMTCGSTKVRIIISSKDAEGIVIESGKIKSLPANISGKAECQECGLSISLNKIEYEVVQ